MISPLKYRFGSQEMHGRTLHYIEAGTPYEMLGNIASPYPQLDELAEIIANLERVVASKQFDYGWGEDACSFTSERDLTYILYDFDEHTITISTVEILQLVRDWLAYLQKQLQPA